MPCGRSRYGRTLTGTITAATYKTPADVPTIVVPKLMLVRENLDANGGSALDSLNAPK